MVQARSPCGGGHALGAQAEPTAITGGVEPSQRASSVPSLPLITTICAVRRSPASPMSASGRGRAIMCAPSSFTAPFARVARGRILGAARE
jgi:hypothetical protein